MLRTSESETEILLGNKHLIGIFLLVAFLLGVSFYGGYMVGRGTAEKKSLPAPSAPVANGETAAAANQDTTGGETHSFPADTGTSSSQTSSTRSAAAHPAENTSGALRQSDELPLGSPKRKSVETAQTPSV